MLSHQFKQRYLNSIVYIINNQVVFLSFFCMQNIILHYDYMDDNVNIHIKLEMLPLSVIRFCVLHCALYEIFKTELINLSHSA